jgi:hypothetical protein
MSSIVYLVTVRLRSTPPSTKRAKWRASEGGGPKPTARAHRLLSSPLALPFSFLATVQGANRPDGVGFQSIKVLLENPATHIIATVRNPDAAVELKELGKDGRVDIVKAEVSSLESVKVSRLVS